MITFLPVEDFYMCSKILDWKRLGQQRNEAGWVLKRLTGELRKINHVLIRMWDGYEDALCHYGMNMCHEWRRRGYVDNQFDFFMERCNDLEKYERPDWLGNNKLHSSHRIKLLTKDYHWYKQFNWVEKPDSLATYFWPK